MMKSSQLSWDWLKSQKLLIFSSLFFFFFTIHCPSSYVCFPSSGEAWQNTTHTHTHSQIQKDQPNAINKAECLPRFVELGASQAQHWHSAVQTEQNATGSWRLVFGSDEGCFQAALNEDVKMAARRPFDRLDMKLSLTKRPSQRRRRETAGDLRRLSPTLVELQ